MMKEARRRQLRDELKYEVNTHECICEFLRLVYDEVDGLPDDERKATIIERLVDCLDMGKRMQARLTYYRLTYEPDRKKADGLVFMPGAAARLARRQARKP